MKNKTIYSTILFGLITGCANSNEIELEGRISMKGSEPFSYLAIKDSKSRKSYKIQNRESFNLIHKQNQIIKVKAEILKEAIGPGFPTEIKVTEVR